MSTVISDPVTDLNAKEWQSALIIGAIVLYGVLTVAGIITVTTFMAVLIKGRSTFKEIPFFSIVWQLVICNMLGIFVHATCKFPLLFVDTSEDTFWTYWEMWGTRVIYFTDTGVALFVLLMALNRFAVFVLPAALPIFSKQRICYCLTVTWFIVVLCTVVKILYGPVEKFNRKDWSITSLFVRQGDHLLFTIVSFLDYAVAVLLLIIYATILFMIRKKRKLHGMESNDDTSLLTQAVVVALSLTAFRMFANVSGVIKTAAWLTWILNILRFSASVCNNMLNPVLFLTTKSVRAILKDMLHCGSSAGREESNNSANSLSSVKGCLPFWKRRRRSIQDIATAGSLPIMIPPVAKEQTAGNVLSPVDIG